VHFAADYDDDDGIALLIAHNVGADPSEMARDGDVDPFGRPIDPALFGLPASATDVGVVARYRIDPTTGRIVDSRITSHQALWGGPALVAQAEPAPDKLGAMFWSSAGVDEELQLARIVDLYADHPHREVALADVPARTPAVLSHIDGQTAEVVDSFAFPAGRWGVSPVYVPRTDAVNDVDGYVVITVISDDADTDGSSCGCSTPRTLPRGRWPASGTRTCRCPSPSTPCGCLGRSPGPPPTGSTSRRTTTWAGPPRP
jgi:all-trans-8'-apo-beta-carotenal 15,15'-oxygenase